MQYMEPIQAKKMMSLAEKTKKTVWISGVTGTGKTCFVEYYLNERAYESYSAENYTPEEIVLPEADGKEHIIILDDLYVVLDMNLQKQFASLVKKANSRKDIWLILISRSSMSQWLGSLSIALGFIQICEEKLSLTRKQQEQCFHNYNCQFCQEIQEDIWKSANGNPLFIQICINEMQKGGDEEEVLERSCRAVWNYFEIHVYEQWSTEVQEFLMKMSIIDEFNIEMAIQITGDTDAGKRLHEAMELGNFMCVQGGEWFQLRRPFCKSMQRRLLRKMDADEIRRLYVRTGDCLSLHGENLKALEMYERAKDSGRISELLIRNARKDPTSGHYYELKDYYLGLPEEMVRKSPELMCGMSLLQSILMNADESERWYNLLKEYAEKQTGAARKETLGRVVYLDIALPHRGIMNMTDIMKNAVRLLGQRKVLLAEFSVTSFLPSQMNGGKDFCEWSKKDRELALTIGKILPLVLGRYGKALVNLALAESFFEKGMNQKEVESLAMKGRMETEISGNVEQRFVAFGVLARLSVLRNQSDYAIKLIHGYRKAAKRCDPILVRNVDAFLCRIYLYQGKMNKAEEWMKSAPDENKELYGLERLRYLTKIRIYIAWNKLESADHLNRQMIYYADLNQRIYIQIECQLLQAIIEYRRGNIEWKDLLQKAVSRAEEYHFVRILSREGSVLDEMLQEANLRWEDS